MMKNKDLIEILQQQDPEIEVVTGIIETGLIDPIDYLAITINGELIIGTSPDIEGSIMCDGIQGEPIWHYDPLSAFPQK